ncbi:MAG TPA: hypothetical protein VL307_16765 [Chitinophagaceae bacterium]|nr:hypothetical protein [Chitinophagaceae bacterium]
MQTKEPFAGVLYLPTKASLLLWTTLVVAILDGIAAIIVYRLFYGYNPVQIYQFVASAIMGNAAYAGGLPVALLGLFFHFLIAFVSSYLFIQLYPSVGLLRSNKIGIGLAYGATVWVVMNLLVFPLTKLPPASFDIVALISLAWHMLLVGLPISLLASYFYQQRAMA